MPHRSHSSVDFSAIPPAVAAAERLSAGPPLGAPGESADWRGEAVRLRTALEDVVALAHANAEARQRVVQMQRRAVAALTGVDAAVSRR